MINSETQSLTQTGTVEVSGRDENEVSFVERSELGWDEYAGKHVTLSRMLSEGSILFVRQVSPCMAILSSLSCPASRLIHFGRCAAPACLAR